MNNIIYDNWENMIGYSEDIIKETKEELKRQIEDNNFENLTELGELIEDLSNYDNDLVKISYHPMGAYIIKKLVEEGENE